MSGRLDGKVCVITGAAGGIGASAAELFRGEGAVVVGVDLRDDFSGVDLALAADVASEDGVIEMFRRARSEYGRIDVLFNNAGISADDDVSVLDTSLEAWQRVQDVNLRSVFLCCKHGIPHLLDGGGGSVINTASFVAVMGAATSQISYTASKGAVLALSRELYASDPAKAARRLVHVPMGRFAEAREVAAAALFLASDESSYITASTFMVDGGLSGAYVTPE
jgi:NAD(P)-dependent dehydrogenase (short-subunit alcohol dehydrogenase family)